MSRLKGKIAIVTGAAGGMGLATARLFVEEGAKVVATDVQAELLQKEVHAIDPDETSLLGLVMDVASPDAWKEVVKTTLDKFGKLDILVNNAGILVTKGILDTDPEIWNRGVGDQRCRGGCGECRQPYLPCGPMVAARSLTLHPLLPWPAVSRMAAVRLMVHPRVQFVRCPVMPP